jgi:ABC-type lipoprotein release transport system permease subunit
MWTLAWRNIWRNKRRTIITAASVLFAVFFSILMRGFHMGTWLKLIDSVLHSYSGYVQVHAKGYWDNKTFDYCLAENDSSVEAIKKVKNVNGLIPRLESFSLISTGNKTKGVITIGIEPEIENQFSELKNKVVSGRYLTSTDSGVMLSGRLAEFLKLKVNDSVVLLSQGYQGAGANGIFRIIGIIHLPSQEFDNQMVFMPLKTAQNFYSANGLLTSYVIDLKDPKKMDVTIRKISKVVDKNTYEVMSWKEMLIELYQAYVSDEGG